jgi:AcrR family transcriptional regulator
MRDQRRQPSPSALGTGRDNDTRHERLLSAAALSVCELGYERATVAEIIRRAQVSRASFYEHFATKEACFLTALEDAQRALLEAVTNNIAAQPQQSVLAATIAALATFAYEQPIRAGLLMNATMAAGPRALEARDHGIDAIAQTVEAGQRWTSAETPAAALPSEILIGTAYRLLGSRLRRGEQGERAVRQDLLDWIAAYEDPTGEARRSAPFVLEAPPHAPAPTRAPMRAPPALAPGRPRRSSAAVIENHRLRLIFATAEIIRRDGYPTASVAEITRTARVDSRVFYSMFADKHAAFRALREFAFQHAMAVTAGAFFAVEDWPTRIWQAAQAFTQFLAQNPALTYACLVESDAGGPETAQRFEDLVAGCTIFLQEGYQYQSQTSPPSHVALGAIAQAVLEVIYRQARSGSGASMAGLVGQVAFICLAPFVGAARASELIDELRGSQAHRPGAQNGHQS